MSQYTVLIVDDHPLMRDAIAAAIEDESDMVVVGEASNGAEAVELARLQAPDVIVMDMYMPVKDGVQAITEIKAENPQARILTLTSSFEENMILAAVEAGALGYLLKDASRQSLLSAIRMVARGEVFLPPNILFKMVSRLQHGELDSGSAGEAPRTISSMGLTDREREVLGKLGQGLSNREIAESLIVSEATVRAHIFHILKKLNMEHRSQAVAYAARQ